MPQTEGAAMQTSTLPRRRHAVGEATRIQLLESAERLFAVRGIDGVTLREIQIDAGQSNRSVITYHFGSKIGLVKALIAQRQLGMNAERDAGLVVLRERGTTSHPRELVDLVVRPMVASIERGEMYIPFLARLSEDPLARSEYWPDHLEDNMTAAVTEELVDAAMGSLPERIRRARSFMFFTSVLNTLSEHARRGLPLSPARVSGYIDGWIGLLTAPVSAETSVLLDR
jgi:AcrR family transcriptional regulator